MFGTCDSFMIDFDFSGVFSGFRISIDLTTGLGFDDFCKDCDGSGVVDFTWSVLFKSLVLCTFWREKKLHCLISTYLNNTVFIIYTWSLAEILALGVRLVWVRGFSFIAEFWKIISLMLKISFCTICYKFIDMIFLRFSMLQWLVESWQQLLRRTLAFHLTVFLVPISQNCRCCYSDSKLFESTQSPDLQSKETWKINK